MSNNGNRNNINAKDNGSPRATKIMPVIISCVLALSAYSIAWCSHDAKQYRAERANSIQLVSQDNESQGFADIFGICVAYADETDAQENNSSTVSESVEGSDDQERGATSGYSTRQGRVSQLNDESHNPYHNDYRVTIDIGSEFATFGSVGGGKHSNYTEGYLVKVAPGGTITLPTDIVARDGYYFVGWSTGGVPETPTWGIGTREIVVDESSNDTRNITLYALYADDNGDGWCTCGAWKQGAYKDDLDQIKADYNEYRKSASSTFRHGVKASENGNCEENGSANSDIFIAVLVALAVVVIIIGDKFFLRWKESN